jgi:LDH2 family malate/lactate/ureidoglycolate dehydrogenase
MDPRARPVQDAGRGGLARFDAGNGWGHHAGRVAVDWAIAASAEHGIAAAVVRNSNHFGIAGWYALRAAHAGRIGISLTNSSPLVAPTRSRQPLIGTNPIAVAAPAGRWGSFCLDMATSTITRGRIEVAARRDEALPVGWAIDVDGNPATTAQAALSGALLPLGGDEEHAGYKGYGLALAVDLLTGVLAGAAFGPNIVGLFSTEGPSDLGQAYLVIDPAAVDPPGRFVARLESYLDQLTGAATIPGAPGRVLVPGEPEAEAERQSAEHGVRLDERHHARLVEAGERYGLPFPRVERVASLPA